MSHKPTPLVTVGSDGKVTCARNFPPFWAVMLVGRDTTNMVNMVPYLEEYILPPVHAKLYGSVAAEAKVSLYMPYLTNRRDLKAGELLALPFDGGNASICCEDFPPMVNSQ